MPCTKRIYPSDHAARKAVRHFQRQKSVRLRTYYCSECVGYHMTSAC